MQYTPLFDYRWGLPIQCRKHSKLPLDATRAPSGQMARPNPTKHQLKQTSRSTPGRAYRLMPQALALVGYKREPSQSSGENLNFPCSAAGGADPSDARSSKLPSDGVSPPCGMLKDLHTPIRPMAGPTCLMLRAASSLLCEPSQSGG